MESNKEKIIKKIISERIKDADNFLRKTYKELTELRKKKRDLPDAEMIGSIQHQIGYMTGLKYESEQILFLLDSSYEEILEQIEENKKIEAYNKKMMDEMFDEIRNEEKTIKKNKNKKENLKVGSKNGKRKSSNK